MSATYDEYAQTVLDKMWEDADAHEDHPEVPIWRGGLNGMITKLIPQAHNGRVSTLLQDSGAIHLVSRGGGPTPAEYTLERRRFATDDEGNPVEVIERDYFRPTQQQRTDSKINELNRRVSTLERQVERLMQHILADQVQEGYDVAQQEASPTLAETLGVEDGNA